MLKCLPILRSGGNTVSGHVNVLTNDWNSFARKFGALAEFVPFDRPRVHVYIFKQLVCTICKVRVPNS